MVFESHRDLFNFFKIVYHVIISNFYDMIFAGSKLNFKGFSFDFEVRIPSILTFNW